MAKFNEIGQSEVWYQKITSMKINSLENCKIEFSLILEKAEFEVKTGI
jgi:hypothetical protein